MPQNQLPRPFKGMETVTHSHSLPQQKLTTFTSSSLLIPSHLLSYFSSRSISFGGTRHYFQYLITTYARHLKQFGLNAKSTKWKSQYQNEGLDLCQKNFKPTPQSWEEFRNIGLAYGLAMCKLFTVLLELEYQRWMEAGFPENFHEKPPRQSIRTNHGVNSTFNTSSKTDFSLNSKNCTLLIRNINFAEVKLDRFCFIVEN